MTKILIDRSVVEQVLGALETVLSDAYHRRFPECCGRPGSECCGNPNEAWTPEDNKIMDVLSPAQRQLSDALRAALAEQPAELEPVAEVAEVAQNYDGAWTAIVVTGDVALQPGEKLYTTAPQPVKREPLTLDQLADLVPPDDTPMSLGEAFVKFARAIERAHGIGGQP